MKRRSRGKDRHPPLSGAEMIPIMWDRRKEEPWGKIILGHWARLHDIWTANVRLLTISAFIFVSDSSM